MDSLLVIGDYIIMGLMVSTESYIYIYVCWTLVQFYLNFKFLVDTDWFVEAIH